MRPRADPAQDVTVEAETDVQTLNVSGVLPTLLQNSTKNNNNPYGTSGNGSGVGGALLVAVYQNTTEASIAGGALVRGHNVSVDATTNLLDVAVAAASGKAGRTGFDGSATVVVVENTTTADIADGATVDAGGAVSVSAGDTLVNVSAAGSALAGNNEGIGVAVGVNVIERDTSAYIGAPDGTTPTGPPAVIDAVGNVSVEAENSGLNVGVALAGSFINPGPQPASGAKPAGGGGGESQAQSQSEDPSEVVQSLSDFLGESPGEDAFAGIGVQGVALPDNQPVQPAATTSYSVAGDVVVDYVNDTTIAAINEPVSTTPTISGDVLTVKATNDTQDVSVAGSAASDTQSVKSTGFAGSLGINAVISTTQAYISGGFIQADQLLMDANRGGFIGAITAGGSGAPKPSGTAIAFSASFNILLPNTDAYVTNSILDLSDDSHVKATDSSLIWSVAGAGTFGGSGGYGVAIGVNLIGFSNQVAIIPNQPATTEAYITGSTVDMTGGTLEVSATNENSTTDPRIISITGFVGLGGGATSGAGAGMIAVNVIKNETEAYVDDSTVTRVALPAGMTSAGPVSLDLETNDTSGIVAIGFAVAGSTGTGKNLGAAIGYNDIQSTITSYLDNVTVNVDGAVTVKSQATEQIGDVDVGIVAGLGSGWAAAGSVSVNLIVDTISAVIDDGSQVTSGGAVS